ncbi:hypothetical protein HN446_01340 [bacterium]|jgi:hypothetical protein|nr:hypothetical protein [bacterium]
MFLKWLWAFTKIIFAVACGVLLSLYLLERDDRIQQTIEKHFFCSLREKLGCEVEGNLKKASLFSSCFVIDNFNVVKKDKQGKTKWRCFCKKFEMHFSWIDCFALGWINAKVIYNNLDAYSEFVDGELLMQKDVSAFLDLPAPVPLSIKSVSVVKGHLNFFDVKTRMSFVMDFNSDSGRMRNILRNNIKIKDGSLRGPNKTFLRSLQGTFWYDFRYDRIISGSVDCTASFPILQKDDDNVLVFGKWNLEAGEFGIYNKDHSFVVSPIELKFKNGKTCFDIQARSSIDNIIKIFQKSDVNFAHGDANVAACGYVENGVFSIKGDANIDLSKYKNFNIENIIFGFLGNNEGFSGTAAVPAVGFSGDWTWDTKRERGDAVITNVIPISIMSNRYWKTLSGDIKAKVSVDKDFNVAGTYDCIATHTKLGTKIKTSGTVSYDKKMVKTVGQTNRYLYELDFCTDPKILLKKIFFSDKNGNIFINIFTKKGKNLNGTVTFEGLKEFLSIYFDTEISGEGALDLSGCVSSKKIDLRIDLKDGNIRLPKTYSFVKDFGCLAVLDLEKRELEIEGARVGFHDGEITCKRICAEFSDAWELDTLCIPMCINDLFVNLEQELFVSISGNLLLNKKKNNISDLGGFLILNSSQFNQNIFSSAFKRKIVGIATSPFEKQLYDAVIDIDLVTYKPMRVKTSFLETKAHCDLKINKTLLNPEIVGTIQLEGGFLSFPYKNLNITNGTIFFFPGQTKDPTIELEAKNKVKRYNVGLNVEGSLLNPHIMFESNPSLTDEQIVALLLAGTEDDSLNIVVPTLLMQNIKNIVLSNDQTKSKLDKCFDALLKPLKSVRLVPKFSDQTGRGGLRGAVEIDVSDRLRALVEKNFSLSEDTRFEVEYLLTDEVGLKAVKDERGDLGGEIEMRWKF